MVQETIPRLLSRIMMGSAKQAKAVIAVVLLLTVASLTVLLLVEPNVETDIQSGYFATNDVQANMFRELRDKVAGVNSEIVYFELEEGAVDAEGNAVTNVTQLSSLQSMEELFNFVQVQFKDRTGHDKVISHTSLPYFVKLLYKQFPESQNQFVLPETEQENKLALNLLSQADSAGATKLYHSEEYDAAVMFIIYDPDTTFLSKKDTGGMVRELVNEWRMLEPGAEGKSSDLWKDAYLDSWGVQSWIYVIDEQVAEESTIFVGAVFIFLSFTLLILFRNLKRAAIGVVTVAIILLWTLAGMTLGGVAIGFVSMAMFPLLLGVGVDYVIHIINEFGTERAVTGSNEEAFDLIGKRGAVALLISTLTTISGFITMIVSTSPMIVEISIATILGIFSVFVLSVTWIPALLQLSVRGEAKEVLRASPLVGRVFSFFGRAKLFTIAFLLVGTGYFASFIDDTEYVIGTVEVNLPQNELWTHEENKHHQLVMYERFQEKIKAIGQETIIQKAPEGGNLATRAALDDMIRVHQAMQAQEFVQNAGGAVNSVPSILVLYETLKDGLQSAGPALLEPQLCSQLPFQDPSGQVCAPGPGGGEYDTTFGILNDYDDAKIRAAFDDMLQREEWEPLLLTFIDKDYSIAWALTFINLPVDKDATKLADDAFSQVVEDANSTYTETNYFGTFTGIEKYNGYTNKWLTISSIASLVVVSILVFSFTRSFRATIGVLLPMVLTFIWWLGALPTSYVDIDLAFIFLIPIAFITSLGSDYAVHLVYNLQQNSNKMFVYKTVGKAVVFSAFTTVVSFFIFTRGAIRGSYEMFQAAVLAIILMTVLTCMCVPLVFHGYKPKVDADEHHG